ncbi:MULTISPECIES: NADPH-dependent FMN reductase [unclassified Sinorhizobium]|uniref:NADPH-dependent FMN reductase n=1 Tax=unclassified Sinorhizobium TaxID=2613772 RepID=UPI0035248BD6
MKTVQVIIGSVRPSRIGGQIASWVLQTVKGLPDLRFEIVDLKDWHLPLDDEPNQPKHGGYLQPHTQAWSDKVKQADGFVFLTPQYNWGYPASLKNALDHLYSEWEAKPAVIVSYGHRGGVKAAEQLRQVLVGLHMMPTETDTNLFLDHDMLDADRRLVDAATAFADRRQTLLKSIGEMAFGTQAH